MTIAYKWAIPVTDYNTDNKFIFCAHWTATAVDGDYTASVYSTCSFPTTEPAIPYASVTEQNVLDWIWANGVDKTATEASLAAQIELQKNPTTAVGVPW
jgi:hypothetical protein